ncbi:MAG: glycosyl hydrolase, partial [Conexibacter sp.]|nr:glycosyl hydrolase [Conexibacter sp.]
MPEHRGIADHGLIGDLRTAALVAIDGTVDWLCVPRFDAPSVFGALLDAERGGHWRLAPTCEVSATHQFYFPDSNVLVTRFLTEDGVVEVQDFLAVGATDDALARGLVRRIVAVRGAMELRSEVRPRFAYGREEARARRDDGGGDGGGGGIAFAHGDMALLLRATVDVDAGDGAATATFSLDEGEAAAFTLALDPDDERGLDPERAGELFEATVGFWRGWLEQGTYRGRWREMVQRSALTLKLLTHRPTGAILAAPTASLPEQVGGERNWDYRYVWSRDAAFSAYALLRLGFLDEARAFVGWLTDRLREADGDGESGPLSVMYDLDGRRAVPEEVLDHLTGYRGSAPVRIGNDAGRQRQLDIYGEVVDSVYLYNKHGSSISSATWDDLVGIVEWVCENWDGEDEGIWETRAGRKDHTYSRLMCWVAIERTIRIARQRGLPGDLERWMTARDAIYRQIMERGYDEERGAFVQHYGSQALDASLLLMPMVKFISPTDPRFLSTLDAIGEELVSDSLVYRYDRGLSPDGLDGEEGTLSICSFWYVEALTRAGRLEQARVALEKMFTYANHLGLYAEQIGRTGDQ